MDDDVEVTPGEEDAGPGAPAGRPGPIEAEARQPRGWTAESWGYLHPLDMPRLVVTRRNLPHHRVGVEKAG